MALHAIESQLLDLSIAEKAQAIQLLLKRIGNLWPGIEKTADVCGGGMIPLASLSTPQATETQRSERSRGRNANQEITPAIISGRHLHHVHGDRDGLALTAHI